MSKSEYFAERVFDSNVKLKDNAMLKHSPELFNEWDFEKNDELGFDVYKATKASNKKAWWICSKCKSSYDSTVNNRSKGNNCTYCRGLKVNSTNSLAVLNPIIASEWHPILNGDLTPHNVTVSSGKKVWWKCKDCSHEWETRVAQKTKDSICPGCSPFNLNEKTSLAIINPKLAKEWHPTRNGELTPHDMTEKNTKKIWWLGSCGHEWEATSANRSRGGKCPYCSNRKLLVGYNDMWTTNPTQARLLANIEDGYRYTDSSEKRVDWKCKDCENIIKNKIINQIKNYGLSCPSCSDGISYPEKLFYNLLKQLNIDFERQKTFSWSSNKKYDFYLSEFDMIVEVHGKQHYEETGRGRSLEEERENDKYKYGIAINNKIHKYIIIDARMSNFEYIKNSILNSELNSIIDLSSVDEDKIEEDSISSFVKIASDDWNSGFTVIEISKKLNVHEATIVAYLKKAAKLDLCDYDPSKQRKVEVVQLSLSHDFIALWESATEAGRQNGIPSGYISICSKYASQKTVGEYIWMRKNDYLDCIDGIKQFPKREARIKVKEKSK